ncbi:response regulator, partial [Saccharopolyspora shandongensis]
MTQADLGADHRFRGREPRILVVEDDPTVAQVVTGYLRRSGYTPVHASDGPMGLELARQMSPDLVVLDVMLPGLDGIQVLRELRVSNQVPVIMLTSLGEEEHRLRGLESG